MHMLMVIGGGVVLLGLFLWFGNLWHIDLALAAKAFIPAWLAVAVVNMWVGVSRGGYSVREELPILGIVFIVPAIVAALAIWRLAR